MPRSAPSREAERAAKLLGAKVAARRSELELTQKQLAERAGISRKQVHNIEHSRSNVKDPTTGRPGPGNARLNTVFRLAHALEVDVTYLVDPKAPISAHR